MERENIISKRRKILLLMISFVAIFCCKKPGICLAETSGREILLIEEDGRFVYEGPIVLEDEEVEEPPECFEQNGKQYQRLSLGLKQTTIPGTLTYTSSTRSYELEGWQEAPETIILILQDDATGISFEREITRKGVVEQGLRWDENFSFPVTVYGYGADRFYLGETEIPAGADLTGYGDLLLEYLGLSEDCYQVDRVEWIGEPYEQEGSLCRDAMAYGEKLIRLVDVVYGGQIRTPDLPAKQYLAVYAEIPVETETIEKIEAFTETEPTIGIRQENPILQQEVQQKSFFEPLKQLIREHTTVVAFSMLFLLAVAGWILLLYLSSKKQKEKAGD